MVALEDPLLFGRKAERVGLPHQRINASEKRWFGMEIVPVSRNLRRQLALDRKQGVVAMSTGQKVEHLLDPSQHAAGELERRDRIGEIRRFRAARNDRHLGLVLGEGARIGGRKVLGPDLFKGGRLAGSSPRPEKGAVALLLRVHAGLSPRRKMPGLIYRDFRLELGLYFGESAPASEKP